MKTDDPNLVLIKADDPGLEGSILTLYSGSLQSAPFGLGCAHIRGVPLSLAVEIRVRPYLGLIVLQSKRKNHISKMILKKEFRNGKT